MMMSDEMSETEETEMMIDDVTEMMTLTGDVNTATGDKTTIAMMTGMTEEIETRTSEDNSETGEIVTLISPERTETGEIKIEMMREGERTETEETAKEMMNEDKTEMVLVARTEILIPAERGERETLTTTEATTTETMLRSDEMSAITPGSRFEVKMSQNDREIKTRMF